jgi:hypothetical protein
MPDEDLKKQKVPSRMSNVAFPKAKYGLYIAFIIIFGSLFLLYKDFIFKIFE